MAKEGADKRVISSRLTQTFHVLMFEPIFSPVNALNHPIYTCSSPFKPLSPVFSHISHTDVTFGPP
ncbi:hypothetical protein, partial [Citrobacter freundii]|uniref:hypothetical protein n=1 Tax=Citrobacter freundii TaxID=546 RepID=UPI00254BA351